MGSLLKTLWRAMILDDAAYEQWREPPNLFLRGIVLIIVVTLVAGLLSFAVDLVDRVSPVKLGDVEEGMREAYKWMTVLIPESDVAEFKEVWDEMFGIIPAMVRDVSAVKSPLPRGIVGFFQAFGSWVSRAATAIGGWMFYGVLVLIFVNLLGGSAKLPEFLGTVALYTIPGLLALLAPIPCLGWLLVLVAMVWSIVVYMKATSVAGNLDTGRTIVAVLAPFFSLIILGIVLGTLFGLWFALLF